MALLTLLVSLVLGSDTAPDLLPPVAAYWCIAIVATALTGSIGLGWRDMLGFLRRS